MDRDQGRTTFGTAIGHFLGWPAVALVQIGFVVTLGSTRHRGVRAVALRLLFDSGYLLAIGFVAACAVGLWTRFVPATPSSQSATSSGRTWTAGQRRLVRAAPFLAIWIVTSVLGFLILSDDLDGAAEKLTSSTTGEILMLRLLVLGASASVPLSALFGTVMRDAQRAWALGLLGLFVSVGVYFFVSREYPAVLLYVEACAATSFGCFFAELRVPRVLLGGPRRRAILVGVVAVTCGVTVFVRPSNKVQVSLFDPPQSLVAPFLARLRSFDPGPVEVPEQGGEWFKNRAGTPDVPPRKPRLLGDDGIVILLTVDALRADVVADDRNAALLPHFADLRKTAIVFDRARSSASQTVPSLTTLFTGKYYSQLYWSVGMKNKIWPHRDESVRFPALLQAGGVSTVHFVSLPDLLARNGVARGFGYEEFVKTARTSPLASELMDRILAILEQPESGRMFVYAHFTDPHMPYDRGGTDGPPFERYLREIALVDVEIGRLFHALEASGLTTRTAVIVSADHGEAFGEHGTTSHASTIYDELLRIPLMMMVPEAMPRHVTAPVALVDVGPTVLEILGVAVPGTFMGQSLLPFVRGRNPKLSRPIVADSSRFTQAMVFPDGRKIIRDPRRGTTELYDLSVDPGENDDLFDDAGRDGERRLSEIAAFFAAHRLQRPGYKLPYRR